MLRFKFGLVLGFVIGWLVASGKAAQLIDQASDRVAARRAPSTTALPADATGGVYDFAVRAAQ